MEYKLIKDKRRKKMIMTVENDGTVVIKAPKWTRTAKADRFYRINLGWIADKRKKLKENSGKIITLTAEDINMLKKKAADVMRRKTEYYSSVMGVKPDSIKITSAYKRWGSCSCSNNRYGICFSYRTMFLSDRCQDYIVVHELAHIKHMNHSADFYAFIEKILPDYRDREREAERFRDYHIYPHQQ